MKKAVSVMQYCEEYDEQIAQMDQLMYWKIQFHPDLIRDSIGDLAFKMNGPDVKVFAVMKGREIIASIMIWDCGEKRAATENIFCIDPYRRKGITAALIEYVCAYLKSEGYEEASLSVYQDNLPAIFLYEKMGYRYEKFNFGIQYETGYQAIVY